MLYDRFNPQHLAVADDDQQNIRFLTFVVLHNISVGEDRRAMLTSFNENSPNSLLLSAAELTPLPALPGSMMEIRAHKPSGSIAIESLFVSVFSKADGEQDGALIGSLAKELIASADSRDLYGFVAVDGKNNWHYILQPIDLREGYRCVHLGACCRP